MTKRPTINLKDEILAIITAEPGIDAVQISDRLEPLYAAIPPGRLRRLATRLFGKDRFIVFMLTPMPIFGRIYNALEDLEDAGLIRWQWGRPKPERGGRRLRHFFPTNVRRLEGAGA